MPVTVNGVHGDWHQMVVTTVDVAVSEQFFGWVFGLGAKVKIVGSEDVVDRFKEELKKIQDQY